MPQMPNAMVAVECVCTTPLDVGAGREDAGVPAVLLGRLQVEAADLVPREVHLDDVLDRGVPEGDAGGGAEIAVGVRDADADVAARAGRSASARWRGGRCRRGASSDRGSIGAGVSEIGAERTTVGLGRRASVTGPSTRAVLSGQTRRRIAKAQDLRRTSMSAALPSSAIARGRGRRPAPCRSPRAHPGDPVPRAWPRDRGRMTGGGGR